MVCIKFCYIWASGSRKEIKYVQSFQTDRESDGWQDDGKQVIKKAHLSLQFRGSKITLCGFFFGCGVFSLGGGVAKTNY